MGWNRATLTGNEMAQVIHDGPVNNSTDDADDLELVAALRRKQPAACEEFLQRFGGRMQLVARRYLLDDQDCDDAVQDAFISAFQAIDQFEGTAQLGTWLHRIVINVCLMKLRSRSRRPEVSIESLLPTFDSSGHAEHPAQRWRSLRDDDLQRSENRDVVRQCIEMLPYDYREVVLLRDIEELSTEETAVALNTSVGAIKTRLHRARQALRTLLEPHFSR